MQNPYNYQPVFLKNVIVNGRSKLVIEHDPKLHFRRGARELYGILDLLAKKYGGFIFAKVETIRKNVKNWKHDAKRCADCIAGRKCSKKYLSEREVFNLIKDFIALGIMSERQTRIIGKREYSGWAWNGHSVFEISGHVCDFKLIDKLPSRSKQKVVEPETVEH